MPTVSETFTELGAKLDRRLGARVEYETRVASCRRVLDVGGRNKDSSSARRLMKLTMNPDTVVVNTDIIADYGPDLVDDICNTSIPPESFDGVYCDAVLEHVADYGDAITNIHSILVPGGEAFIYVPFFFEYHDRMDYHRFTITEVARMLDRFSETKIFVSERQSGYGYVFWSVLTYARINRLPRLHFFLASATNVILKRLIHGSYMTKKRDHTLDDAIFFYTYVYYNHGFCAWMRK
jgi:SAM-dependent methyltransferase